MALGAMPLHAPIVAAHLGAMADELCHLSGDRSTGPDWYAKRVGIMSIYTATGARE